MYGTVENFWVMFLEIFLCVCNRKKMYCVCIGYLKFSVKYSVKFLLELKLFSDYYRAVMLSRLFLNHMQSMIVEHKSGSISFMTIQ